MIMWSWFVSFDDPTVAWRGAGCGGSAEFNARMKVALGEVVMRHGSKGGVGDKTGITWVAGWGCGGDFTWPRSTLYDGGCCDAKHTSLAAGHCKRPIVFVPVTRAIGRLYHL